MLLLQSIWQVQLSTGLFLNLQGSLCMQHQPSPRRASLQLNKQDSRWWHTPSWGQGWSLKGTSNAWTILPKHPTYTLGIHCHKIRDYIWHCIQIRFESTDTWNIHLMFPRLHSCTKMIPKSQPTTEYHCDTLSLYSCLRVEYGQGLNLNSKYAHFFHSA